MNATEALAGFMLDSRAVPQSAREAAKRVILDTVGCAAAASRTDLGLMVERLVEAQGATGGSARVIGTGQRTTPLMAAYANGRLANILDFDETYMMLGHHSHSALAAVLAIAPEEQLTGREVLEAFVVGYEIGARVGRYVGSPLTADAHTGQLRWVFPGSALATYAACAAASVAIGLNEEQIINAFGICAQYLPSDVNVWDSTGSSSGRMHSLKYEDNGWTAHTGLMAALVAREGITASSEVLNHPEGLAQRVRPDSHAEMGALTDGLGQVWAIERTSIKPWPSCRWFHYPLTALELVLEAERIEAEEIESIELQSAWNCVLFDSTEIAGNLLVNTQFSLPHSAAMLALGVQPGLGWFDPSVVYGEAARSLRAKVSVAVHPATLQAENWHLDSGSVRVPSRALVRARGQVFEAEADRATGDPGAGGEPPAVDVEQKFDRLVGSLVPGAGQWGDRVRQLRTGITDLERVSDVDALVAMSCPRTAAASRVAA